MIRVLMSILLFVLLIFTFVYFFQRQLIYFPNKQNITPKDFSAPEFRIIHLTTDDHLKLMSWYLPAKENFPTILYLHGNAGHIGNRIPLIQPYIQAGYGILLLEYRGYAQNPGHPTEAGLYGDARAAMHFLNQQGIYNNCIILLGESLGTGVAVQMATEFPVAAVILQSPFTSLIKIGQHHYPFLPVKLLLKDHFDSLQKINKIKSPLLVLYAVNDNVVPAIDSERLFMAARQPKFQYKFDGEDFAHDNFVRETYYQVVLEFLKKSVRCH